MLNDFFVLFLQSNEVCLSICLTAYLFVYAPKSNDFVTLEFENHTRIWGGGGRSQHVPP